MRATSTGRPGRLPPRLNGDRPRAQAVPVAMLLPGLHDRPSETRGLPSLKPRREVKSGSTRRALSWNKLRRPLFQGSTCSLPWDVFRLLMEARRPSPQTSNPPRNLFRRRSHKPPAALPFPGQTSRRFQASHVCSPYASLIADAAIRSPPSMRPRHHLPAAGFLPAQDVGQDACQLGRNA